MQHKSAYIWGLLGRFAPQGLHLLTTMVLARFLDPKDFGTIGVLSIIFVVANTLLDSGLGGSLIKEKNITRLDCSTIGFFNITVSLIIYVILFICSGKIEHYFKIDGLGNVVKVISLVFPCTAFGIVPKAILNRNLAFKQSCNNAIIGAFVASLFAIVAAIMNAGVYSLVTYQVTVSLVTVTCNYISSKYQFSLKFSFSSLKRLLPFGFTTTLSTVIDTIYENLLTTMTGKYMSVQQAGYIFQAKKIEELSSTSIATTVGTVTFPILTVLKDDMIAFIKEARSTFSMILSLSFPLLITIAIHSYSIISLLFGVKWYDAGGYLRVLTFAGLFLVAETLIRNYIKALCEVKKLLIATIVKRVIGIGLILTTLYVQPDYMIYSYVISSALGLLLNMFVYSKISDEKLISQIFLFGKLVTPSLIYYFIYVVVNINDSCLSVQLLYSLICLFVIYLIVLPLLGVNIGKLNRK